MSHPTKPKPHDRMPTPTLHLNGSGRRALVGHHKDVLEALRDVQRALARATPHGRDYYPQGRDAYERARDVHAERIQAVEKIRQAVEVELMALVDAPGTD